MKQFQILKHPVGFQVSKELFLFSFFISSSLECQFPKFNSFCEIGSDSDSSSLIFQEEFAKYMTSEKKKDQGNDKKEEKDKSKDKDKESSLSHFLNRLFNNLNWVFTEFLVSLKEVIFELDFFFFLFL